MVDGREILSKATGLSKQEITDIWGEVKENRAKLKSCKRHTFPGGKVEKLGDKYRCIHCGGTENFSNIGAYIDGYVAGGGSAQDIWPGWE